MPNNNFSIIDGAKDGNNYVVVGSFNYSYIVSTYSIKSSKTNNTDLKNAETKIIMISTTEHNIIPMENTKTKVIHFKSHELV